MKAFNVFVLFVCLILSSFPSYSLAGVSGSWDASGGASGSYDPFAPVQVINTDVIFKNEAHTEAHSKVKLTLTGAYNEFGAPEVKIESRALPKFSKHSNPILGYGRDLNNNGQIDTWFLVTKTGIEVVKKEGKHPFGTDILNEVLHSTYKTSVALNVASATTSILGHLFLSVGQSLEFTEKYYKDWMNLEELNLNLAEGIEKGTLTQREIDYFSEIIQFGYQDLSAQYKKFGEKTLLGYALADVALWVTGGVLFNFGAKCLARLGLSLSEKAFVQSMKESVVGFVEKQNAKIATKLENLKGLVKKKSTAVQNASSAAVTAVVSKATFKMALTSSLISYRTKRTLNLYIGKTFKWPKKIYQGAMSEWKYIAINAGVQISSEAYARYDEVKSDSAFETAQNLLTNPDVIQNVSFMSVETIMMTGISKNLKTTKARFAASGAVAFTNSSVMNFVIKDDANLSRVGVDMAWESIVGNAQVQLDLKALEYFEKMAMKKNNPKLKLVGYVITLVDMGVGYYVYSKVTDKVENLSKGETNKDVPLIQEPTIMLVPVLAEHN